MSLFFPFEDQLDSTAEVGPLSVDYVKLDLSSFQSTMDFIQEVKRRSRSLNVLVCNAGIAFTKQGIHTNHCV